MDFALVFFFFKGTNTNHLRSDDRAAVIVLFFLGFGLEWFFKCYSDFKNVYDQFSDQRVSGKEQTNPLTLNFFLLLHLEVYSLLEDHAFVSTGDFNNDYLS